MDMAGLNQGNQGQDGVHGNNLPQDGEYLEALVLQCMALDAEGASVPPPCVAEKQRVNKPGPGGCTALVMLCAQGRRTAAEALIRCLADINLEAAVRFKSHCWHHRHCF